jgi:competence protein ComEC
MTVSGRDGREADARGEVTIFVHSGVSFRQGERIKTSIPVIATERNRGGTDTSYLSFGGAGTLRSLGISDPLLRLRSTVLENIFRSTSGMGAAAGPLFRALFTGNQDTLDPAVVQLFRRSGCAHVLALSGMHLGILTALVGWFFSRILGRNAGYVLGLICVLLYLGVVGAKASLVRAGLMYAVAGYSVLRSRKPGGLATLALCFLIQLFCFPANGLTVSFQLSYLALFGILLLAPTVVDALAPYITRGAAALVGAGVGAQLAVVPLVLVVFGTFYPVGIAAGILLGVLVTAFIWSGIVYLVVAGALPALTVYAAIVPQELEHIIVAVARIASHAPASSLPAPVAAAGCAAIAVFILHFRH